MHADLVALGINGSDNLVAASARARRAQRQEIEKTTGRCIYMPMSFGASETLQFDWHEDWALIAGERT